MKIRQVQAELLHTDGQTDRQTERYDEANDRFSLFPNAPKNRIKLLFFWVPTPCQITVLSNVLENHTACIFRTKILVEAAILLVTHFSSLLCNERTSPYLVPSIFN